MLSVPRTNELAPIDEECLGTPDWESAEAACEPSNTVLRNGMSRFAMWRSRLALQRDERAAQRAAVKRGLRARRSVLTGWPADGEVTEVRGRVTLRESADPHAEGLRAVCRIREGVLTMNIEEPAAAGAKTEVVVAEVPVEALAVCLLRGRADMFKLATVYESEMVDEIYCFCDDPPRRDRWTAVFRRMGVAVFDLRD